MMQTNNTSPEPTLVFIPDISGFTKFITNTEITHSQHIIEELLEVLIDANEIGLEISEIEGDAILFYRIGKTVSAAEILAQVEKMYVRFHAHLRKYETQRICQCGACCSTGELALKFIIHYGEVSIKHVKSFNKLFGREIIVAHRLMKNNIELEEYVLITHKLLNACNSWVEIREIAWEEPQSGEDHYDFGSVPYCFFSLSPLSAHIPEPRIEDFGLSKAVKCLEVESIIHAPIEMVFDIVSDARAKHLWMVGVSETDQINNKITRSGTTHRCIMNPDGTGPFFVSHSFSFDKDKITWTDTNPSENFSLVFTFRRIGNKLTRTNLTILARRNILQRLMYRLFTRKKQFQFFTESFSKLDDYCQDKLREGTPHPMRIILTPTRKSMSA